MEQNEEKIRDFEDQKGFGRSCTHIASPWHQVKTTAEKQINQAVISKSLQEEEKVDANLRILGGLNARFI